ncbi:MAG: histidine--tRNA ligase [Deltaproteobacteria bacterium]|jgi:histidyl-tRNA synthetase|nr:histidine--tRNA ligase [Deltaproteobacteria bacterium]
MAKKIKAPSGMRDFLPDELRKRKYVIKIISDIYEKHGFSPLETPSMERLSLLLDKYGDEGEKLVFKIMKRGDKLARALADGKNESELADMGLRYDLTVPLARVYSNNRHQLTGTFKRYQIQPVWRADRPARGRFREFYQCDVDIIGSSHFFAELDIFLAVCEIMDKLNFSDYFLSLNDRNLLSAILKGFACPAELETSVLTTLDKLDKIGVKGVVGELESKELPDGLQEKLKDYVTAMAEVKDEGNQAVLEKFSIFIRGFNDSSALKYLEKIEKIMTIFSELGYADRLIFDPLLARGLDYYTGSIFELKIGEEKSSFGGGGRYDNLIGDIGGQQVAAVGFSFGLERIIDHLLAKEMLEIEHGVDLCLACLDEKYFTYAAKVAAIFRNQEIKVDFYPRKRSPSKIFRWASKKGIPRVVLIGGDEVTEKKITVKNFSTGKFVEIKLDKIDDFIKKIKT